MLEYMQNGIDGCLGTYMIFLQCWFVENAEDPSHLSHDGTKTKREANGG